MKKQSCTVHDQMLNESNLQNSPVAEIRASFINF